MLQVSDRQLSLFEYIEDGDLWKWQLRDSKFFYAGLISLNTGILKSMELFFRS